MESACSSRTLEINCNRSADVGNRISKTQIVKKTTLAKQRGNIKGSCTYNNVLNGNIYILAKNINRNKSRLSIFL